MIARSRVAELAIEGALALDVEPRRMLVGNPYGMALILSAVLSLVIGSYVSSDSQLHPPLHHEGRILRFNQRPVGHAASPTTSGSWPMQHSDLQPPEHH